MIDIDSAIVYLNQLLELDSDAISKLVASRVECNEALAWHETVQVGQTDDGFEVGLLGIINGLFGVDEDGWGYIAAVIDDDGHVLRFGRTARE